MTSLLSFLVILSGLCLTDRTGRSADKGPAAPAGLLIDLQDNRTIEEDKWSSELTEYDILLIGEEHRQKSHHQAQLDIIRNLKIFSGRSLAIGLEMFRIDHQKILDKWVKGEIDEVAFLEAYYTNWHYDWHLYRDIFIYARVYHLPLIALNAPRGISNQVAMAGFDSLSPEQRGQLPELSCNVDQRYMDFIRKAYGRHPHGKMNFTFFCEARLLRDTTMAITALTYLESCPQHQMIILTGRGHALKSGGILQQIKSRSNLSCAVILPETDTSALKRLSGKDANYIHISQKQPAAKH
jgi:uncharacterized iron-regulated protein